MGNLDYNQLLKEVKTNIENRGNLLFYEICKGESTPKFGDGYAWLDQEMEKNNLNNLSKYHIFAFSPKRNSLDDTIISFKGIMHNLLKLDTNSHFYSKRPKWEFDRTDRGYRKFEFGGISYVEEKASLKLNIEQSSNSVASFDKKSIELKENEIDKNKLIGIVFNNLSTKKTHYKIDILENIVILPYLNEAHFKEKYSTEKQRLQKTINKSSIYWKNSIFDYWSRNFKELPTKEIEEFISLIKPNSSFIGDTCVISKEDGGRVYSTYSISEIKKLIADEKKEKKILREQEEKIKLLEDETRLKESLKKTKHKLATLRKDNIN